MLPTCAVQFDCPFIQNVWPLIEGKVFSSALLSVRYSRVTKASLFLMLNFIPVLLSLSCLIPPDDSR